MARKSCFVKLEIEGEIVEEFFGPSFLWQRQQIHFHHLLKLIEAARLHHSVQSLLLIIKPTVIGWAQIEEIHRLLARFHADGKRSYAYLEHADNKSYYLAAGAQRIYLSPATTLELVGLRLEVLYFKKLLEYLGIEPEVVQIGAYKSAAEPFDREGMSEQSREMGDAILTDLQERMKERIAANRSVSESQVQDWIDQGPYSAQSCAELGLTDGVYYEDELEKLVENEGPGLVDLPSSKLRTQDSFLRRTLTFYRPQVAYIIANGVIASGESRSSRGGRSILGADTLKHLLQAAAKQKRVKAIVLRINSPGGSALSSDLIWREIKRANERKPVIISFGDLAASGGYYIATAARKVLAAPSTLTGSIGVIGGKLNLQGLFAKVGIGVDGVEKGKRAGYTSLARPFSAEEAQVVREQMRQFYEELFLEKVAEGRQKSRDSVRQAAEGRVWTGAQALELGLLDEIGGLLEAFEAARVEAGLPETKKARIVTYTKKWSWRSLFSLPFASPVSEERVFALLVGMWSIR